MASGTHKTRAAAIIEAGITNTMLTNIDPGCCTRKKDRKPDTFSDYPGRVHCIRVSMLFALFSLIAFCQLGADFLFSLFLFLSFFKLTELLHQLFPIPGLAPLELLPQIHKQEKE